MQPDRDEVIGLDECLALLQRHHVGRIAFVDGQLPVILPVNFIVDRDTVILRTDPGSKVKMAAAHRAVAFEIGGIDPGLRTGWSVLIRGHAKLVVDAEENERLSKLPLTAWAEGTKSYYIVIQPVEITGRRINVPALASNYQG